MIACNQLMPVPASTSGLDAVGTLEAFSWRSR